MQTSIFLGEADRVDSVIAAAGALINRKSMGALAQDLRQPGAPVFCWVPIDFAGGLAIVLVHNVWVADWRVIITLLGWLLLVRGAVRILIPDQVKPFGKKLLNDANAVIGSLGVTIVLGLC